MNRKDAKVPQDANHALLVGEIAGTLALKGGMDVHVLTRDGNYLDTLAISRPSGTWLLRVAPEDKQRSKPEDLHWSGLRSFDEL